MLKEQVVNFLKKNERIHEDFRMGVSFGHFLVSREDLKAIPYSGENGIESLLEYLTRNDWEGIYEEDALIGVQKGNATVLLGAGGQVEFHVAKTDSLKVVDKAYLDFLHCLGSELESRKQLLLSVGYQPVSKVSEIETVPMAKAKLLEEALKDDPAALQQLKGTAKTVVTLDYAHSDDFEKKYRVVHALAPAFAVLLDNVPTLDGTPYKDFVAGIKISNEMKTPLAQVSSIVTAHSFKYAQYANFVGECPAVAMVEGDKVVATDKTNSEVYDDIDVNDDMIAGVLDMVMPEIKVTKEGIELHCVDALPYPLNMAYVGLVKGLIYSPDHLNALIQFVDNISAETQDEIRKAVVKTGMETKFNESLIKELSKDLYFMATPELPEGERHYTQPLDAIIFKNICPKEITRRQLTSVVDGQI